MNEPWSKIKKKYWVGIFVFTFFVVFSYFMAPSYNLADLTNKTVRLSSDPIWKEKHHKGDSYWIELNFAEESKKYEIDGIDYKYLNYPAFKDSIKEGDTVTIGARGNNILTFQKNGIQYLKFDKAQFHKIKNRLFARSLFYTGLVCCLIPLFFSNYPTLKINERRIKIRFDWILLISLTIAFIILYNTVGFEFVSGDRFAK